MPLGIGIKDVRPRESPCLMVAMGAGQYIPDCLLSWGMNSGAAAARLPFHIWSVSKYHFISPSLLTEAGSIPLPFFGLRKLRLRDADPWSGGQFKWQVCDSNPALVAFKDPTTTKLSLLQMAFYSDGCRFLLFLDLPPFRQGYSIIFCVQSLPRSSLSDVGHKVFFTLIMKCKDNKFCNSVWFLVP